MKFISTLHNFNVENKRVLVRADLNVPLNGTAILNDYRLQSIQPTLNLIVEKGGKIILITHIGRPHGPTPSLSTQLLIPWFNKAGYAITFAKTIEEAYQKSLEPNKSIVLLENLRFFHGEKEQDISFAKSLARLGDYYVNDAFATMHRTDASIYLTPTFFFESRRTFGLLVEKELEMLNILLSRDRKGFVLILGGGKVADKLPLIEHMLDKVETILLCPAIVFSFLAAQAKNVGKSLVDPASYEICKKILEHAQQNNVHIITPADYLVAQNSINGILSEILPGEFKNNDIGISIGPKTIEIYSQLIQNAHTIFFNAAMGFASRQETMQGTYALLQSISYSKALGVIGGGDSVSAAQKIGINNENDFLSTGGGATLTYLSGKTLPGLLVLNN